MAIQCEMAKGSVLLWTGATLHAGGSNSTDAVRKSVLSGYVCSWLRSEHRFWAHAPLLELAQKGRQGNEQTPEISDDLYDLLGFGPHDGSAPGGGGAARDGWTNPRSQHYYLGRTQEQAAEERDPSKYDGWNYSEVYYEGPGAGLQRRKKGDEATE